MLQYVTTGITVVALLLIGIVAVQNIGSVELKFLAWSASVSQVIVILGSYVLGMMTGGSLLHLVRKYFNRS